MKELSIPQQGNQFYKIIKADDIKIELHDKYLIYKECSLGKIKDEVTDEMLPQTWTETSSYINSVIFKEPVYCIDISWAEDIELYILTIYINNMNIGIAFKKKEKALELQSELLEWKTSDIKKY